MVVKIVRAAWASPPSGRPGRLMLFQAIMSKCAHGTSSATNSLQIERRSDGAAERHVGRVVDVGHLAVEHAAVAGEQRQPPHRLGDLVAGGQQLVGQGVIVAEQRRQVGAQRHPGGAGQRGAIDHHRRLLRGAFEQGVAQDQPALGVGIADLDGDALARRHHVERPEGVARHAVLDRRHQQAQAHRQPSRHHHGGDGHHGRGTRPCPSSCSACRSPA